MWQERAKIGQGWAIGAMLGNNVDVEGHRTDRAARPRNKKHNVAACVTASNVQTET